MSKELRAWTAITPFSADPLHYDAMIHHETMTSVLLRLVSKYKSGEYVGMAAESWKTSPDHRIWTFYLRSGMRFEDGAPITPEIVANSLRRIAYFQNKEHSKSGLLDQLVGFESVQSPNSEFDGLKVSGNSITLTFKVPQPKLLESVSFGIYSIVSPKDFDQKTGLWKNQKQVTASNAYKITHWSDSKFVLELRNDFPAELRHPNPIEKVIFGYDPKDKPSADLIFGTSTDTDSTENHLFYGAVASNIAYAQCISWSHPKSICHDIKVRRALRSSHYKALEEQGFKPIRSFFPLAIPGVKELETKNSESMKVDTISGELRYKKARSNNAIFSTFNTAIQVAARSLELKPVLVDLTAEQLITQIASGLKSYTIDLVMLYTGILIDDPISDIKFMFQSKQGIRLPDTDGLIHQELSKSKIDIQKINHLLWEQAVIWPVSHFSNGVWAKKNIDFSRLNQGVPPTEFLWIGWK